MDGKCASLELSIIVVHHKTPWFLKMCLNSIKKTAAGIDYELIIIDSSSSRISRDIVTEIVPNAIFLPYKSNLGYSRGVNEGLRLARGNYILILNPDVIVTGDNLIKLLSFIKKHPDIGIVGPQLRNFNNTIQNSFFRFYKPLTVIARRSILGKLKVMRKVLDDFLMADVDPNKIQTPDWIMGSTLLISRHAFEKVGFMDERFFMYFEDVDWARRFWHNGYKVVYYPEAFVYHYHRHESKTKLGMLDVLFNKKTHWHILSAIKYFIKYRKLSHVNKYA